MNDDIQNDGNLDGGSVAIQQPDAAVVLPQADPGLPGFRLEELQILNFGTYDGAPSVIRFGRGGAIFTGRNGVGKTTAIDAFRMLIAQEPSFNDATTPEARKRDRDIRTYYQGVLGKLQREGQREYRVLRSYEDRKFMAIVGIFSDAQGHVLSAARLVQYDTQGQGNSQRYIIAQERLDIARDFTSFETGRTIRASLADKRVRVYDTFNTYRAALSGFFGIEDPRQAWALFERAIGTKTVDNLTEFMRDLILPASSLEETADQLVLSTIALDEAYRAVKEDEAKLSRLHRIVGDIDEFETSFQESVRLQQLQSFRRLAHAAVLARSIRIDLKQRQSALASTSREHTEASGKLDALARRVMDLELQERNLGGQAVQDWRRDIETRETATASIRSNLAKITRTLAQFGISSISFEESHHTEEQWERIKSNLRAKARAIPERTADMDNTLAQLSAEIAALQSGIENRTSDLRAAERVKSNLPRQLIEVREELANMLGVSTSALPFFGELVRVAPAAVREGWEGALNRLLGSPARRLLVPDRLYQAAAALIDGRHLGLRLEYDRVDLSADRKTRHDQSHATGKLEVRQDSEFAGYVRHVLDNRYDHVCFASADEGFRRAKRALTKAGQSKDGDRHIKDDRSAVSDRSSFMLGWDTEERAALLRHDLDRLEREHKTANESKAALRARRDGLMIQANNMTQLVDALGDFQSVDIELLNREILEREEWITEATARNPDYLAITQALEKTRDACRAAKNAADKLADQLAIERNAISEQGKRLSALEAERADRVVPLSAWKGYRRVARGINRNSNIFTVGVETASMLGDGIWESIRGQLEDQVNKQLKRRAGIVGNLLKQMTEYLATYPTEAAHLSAEELGEERAMTARQEWRLRQIAIESRELIRHRERLQQAMTDAIDNGIVNVRTQLEKEKLEIRNTIDGINQTLKAVTYDPAHNTRIRFVPHDSASQRIANFTRDLKQVTDDWIGNRDGSIEGRYLKTKRFIDQVKNVPENTAWRSEVLDSRRWFTFVAQEYKTHGDGSEEIVNDYDGASGSSGGQKERLAMTVMAAGLAWRFGMVNEFAAARAFRVLMLDEAFKNSHDDTTRALLELFKAFGFQMIFAMPSKNLAVVSNHIERAFAVDTKNWRTILTVHALKDLVYRNQSATAAAVLQTARDAGVDIAALNLAEIDPCLAGLSVEAVLDLANADAGNQVAAE